MEYDCEAPLLRVRLVPFSQLITLACPSPSTPGNALVVRTEGRARSDAAPVLAAGPALSSAPLVVLVNDHTASASEIAAGALRDNCRAVLAGGPRTYGKGLIQSVYELSDGSGLVLTVGRYLTPAGTDIDLEGLRADFGGLPAPADADATLRACKLERGRGGGLDGGGGAAPAVPTR